MKEPNDKRTKAWKAWKQEQDNITLAGTTETTIVEIIEDDIQIETNDDDIEIARLSMAIKETIPAYLLSEIMQLVDCECRIEAFDKFMDDNNFRISVSLQNAINRFYMETFNEKIRRTSCSACMRRRITRVRDHIKTKVNG